VVRLKITNDSRELLYTFYVSTLRYAPVVILQT